METITRPDELTEFLPKTTPNPNKEQTVYYSDSPKDCFCECRDTSYTKYEIFNNSKEGNGKYAICWYLTDKFSSMRWDAKPEKV